jgi:hypothetical protein
MVAWECPGPAGSAILNDLDSLPGKLEIKYASSETAGSRPATESPVGDGRIPQASSIGLPDSRENWSGQSLPVIDPMGLPLRHNQQIALANLLRVRALVGQTRARLEQQRTHEFLNACSQGNQDRIRVVSWFVLLLIAD